jgi:hypothetical protein
MKALFKIIIGLAVLVASVNATRAAFADYQFTDAVHEGLLFDSQATGDQVVEMVVRLANQYEIPLTAEDVRVRTVGQELRVDMTYTTDVVLIPGVFSKEWTFTPSTSVRRLTGSAR